MIKACASVRGVFGVLEVSVVSWVLSFDDVDEAVDTDKTAGKNITRGKEGIEDSSMGGECCGI